MKLNNVEWLLNIRRDGKKPNRTLTVSVVGPIDKLTLVVPDDASIESLDVRPLVGLHVCVAHVGKRFERVIKLIDKIHMLGVAELYMWNIHDGRSCHVSSFSEVSIFKICGYKLEGAA